MMNKKGPIIIIEDDLDDQEVLQDVFSALNYENEIVYFSNGEEAMKYLSKLDINPFLIFSDINMPLISGGELRKEIQEGTNTKLKSVPFLFFTTSANHNFVLESYEKSIQGFFIKPADFSEIKETMKVIIEYWLRCISLN